MKLMEMKYALFSNVLFSSEIEEERTRTHFPNKYLNLSRIMHPTANTNNLQKFLTTKICSHNPIGSIRMHSTKSIELIDAKLYG